MIARNAGSDFAAKSPFTNFSPRTAETFTPSESRAPGFLIAALKSCSCTTVSYVSAHKRFGIASMAASKAGPTSFHSSTTLANERLARSLTNASTQTWLSPVGPLPEPRSAANPVTCEKRSFTVHSGHAATIVLASSLLNDAAISCIRKRLFRYSRPICSYINSLLIETFAYQSPTQRLEAPN